MQYEELTKEQLISNDLFEQLIAIKNPAERTQAETKCEWRAKELKIATAFNKNYKQFKIEKAKSFRSSAGGNKTDFIDQPIELECGEWIADGFGVKKEEFNQKNGEYCVKSASPIPILPTEILENVDTGTEKIKLSFFKDSWRSIICERKITASATKIIELADKGIEVNSENSKNLVKYIADCVALNLDNIPRLKAISRLGWYNDVFIPYTNELRFDGEEQNKYLYEAVTQKGSLERWIEYTHKLREKSLLLRLQMGTSFASPILKQVGALPFVLHFWGGTGNGKTVGMAVSASIWGNPEKGKLWRVLDNTTNFVCNMASFLHNIPVCLDELQLIKKVGENYDKLIMKCCSGIDRGRMTYDKANQTKTWYNSFIFTGEEPVTKFNSGGGAVNRVIEIEALEKVVEDGRAVIQFINENYGAVGIKYIENLQNETRDLKEEFTEIFNGILKECNTEEKQAYSMAAILLGDRLACRYFYPEEKPLEIKQIKKYLKTADEIDVTERAYEFIIDFIGRNQNRFSEPSSNTGEFWGMQYHSEGYTFINKTALLKALENEGYDFNACKTKWVEKGYLFLNSQGRYVHQRDICTVRASYIKLKTG